MKQVILAAAISVFAFAVQAAPANTSTDQAANAATMMSTEDCAKAMAECKDQDCKDKLVKEGCKAEG